MSIQAQRSRYKKQTAHYFKDNLLDIIDIGETLSKNRFIQKVPLNHFIFKEYISNYLPSNNIAPLKQKNNISDLNPDNIDYEDLNNNKFHINFYNLKLEYKNDYIIHFTQKYYPIEILGTGAFGLVISVIEIETKQKLAVKIIDKKKVGCASDIESVNFQFKLLKNLDNPRIMKIFDILDNQRYVFIFMELIEGGNLKELIIHRYLNKNISYLFRDSECATIMKGLLEALKYLHQNYIIHRDIKPENILFKKKNDLTSVVLCDFGLAYELTNYDAFITETCGTTIYMAPEILNHRGYDFLIDSFSSGIVLYELSSGGAHPFYEFGMSKNEYINKILKTKCSCNFSEEMPLLARNLFLKLCKYEPLFRYEPYKALRHPWITRSNKSQIPMTLLEEYNKSEKIQIFKGLLSSTIALILIKKKYSMTQKSQTQSQLDIVDTILNESNFDNKIIKKNSNNNNANSPTNFMHFTHEKFAKIQNFNNCEFPVLRTKTTRNSKQIHNKSKDKNLFPKIEINKKDNKNKNIIQLNIVPIEEKENKYNVINSNNINRNKKNRDGSFLKTFSTNVRKKNGMSGINNINVINKIMNNDEQKNLANLQSYSKKEQINILLSSNKTDTKYRSTTNKKKLGNNIFLQPRQNSKRLLMKDFLNVKVK